MGDFLKWVHGLLFCLIDTEITHIDGLQQRFNSGIISLDILFEACIIEGVEKGVPNASKCTKLDPA